MGLFDNYKQTVGRINLNVAPHPAARPGAATVALAGAAGGKVPLMQPGEIKPAASQGFTQELADWVAHGVHYGTQTSPAAETVSIGVMSPGGGAPGVAVPVDQGLPPGSTDGASGGTVVPVSKDQVRAFYVHYYVHLADALK